MPSPLKHPLLLIISDSSMKTAFLKKALKEEYTLLVATTEAEALDTLYSSDVAGIIIDEKNAVSDPLSMCQKIRAFPSYHTTPIILITTSLKKSHTQKALRAGFSDFVIEPLEKEEIDQRLTVAFSREHMQKKMSTLPPYIAKTAKGIKKSKINLALRLSKVKKGDFFRELTKAHPIDSPLCILLIEVDDYALLCKDKGEEIAKSFLHELAIFLRQHLRTKDLLFPHGDYGFLAILPTTSAAAAHTIADMLREEVGSNIFSADDIPCATTISIGLVHYDKESIDPHSSSFEYLITRATKALHIARKKGNRTISSSAEEARNYEISI